MPWLKHQLNLEWYSCLCVLYISVLGITILILRWSMWHWNIVARKIKNYLPTSWVPLDLLNPGQSPDTFMKQTFVLQVLNEWQKIIFTWYFILAYGVRRFNNSWERWEKTIFTLLEILTLISLMSALVFFSIVTERVEILIFIFCGSQVVIRLWG